MDPVSEQLIDRLVKVRHAGIGYSGAMAGSQFLPLTGSGRTGMLILGRAAPRRSATLTRLVARGLRALPSLLRHLNDHRPIALPPVRAMMWLSRAPEVDFNRRTERALLPRPRSALPSGGPRQHQVTVGDLCFVAIGQIVNRGYNAVRYQPTGGLIVNSPPLDLAIRSSLRNRWRGLTLAAHKRLLTRDFVKPDFDGRRIGAYRRLVTYYPLLAARLVVSELRRPSYDLFATHRFVRRLYGVPPRRWRGARMRFLARYGGAQRPAVDDGIVRDLFGDLSTQEAYEQKRISPPHTGAGYRARQILVQVYGRKRSVQSSQRFYPRFASHTARGRLIKALLRPKTTATANRRVDRALLALLGTTLEVSLALAVMEHLLGHGYTQALRAAVKRLRPRATADELKSLAQLQARLR